MPTKPCPTENVEQINFVKWCTQNNIKVHHSANERYAGKAARGLGKMMGLSAGFPDLVVVIRAKQSNDGLGYLLGIEMKRVFGSSTSKEQTAWIDLLTEVGVPSRVCKGAEEAKKFVREYIDIKPKFNDEETF